MKKFLNIIIPCYNCEKTICTTLDSILRQTCKDFRIVCVDDISTDRTFQILKTYEAKFPDNIIAIQVKDKEYGDGARKYGYDYNHDSEFIWFVDADDELNGDNAIQTLYDINKDKKLDMYIFNCDAVKFVLHETYKGLSAAPWFRIVRTKQVVFNVVRQKYCSDTIQSYMQYDSIQDDRLFYIDQPLYKYNGVHDLVTSAEYFRLLGRNYDILSKYNFKKTYMKARFLFEYSMYLSTIWKAYGCIENLYKMK